MRRELAAARIGDRVDVRQVAASSPAGPRHRRPQACVHRQVPPGSGSARALSPRRARSPPKKRCRRPPPRRRALHGRASQRASPIRVMVSVGSDSTASACGWASHCSNERSATTGSPSAAAFASKSSGALAAQGVGDSIAAGCALQQRECALAMVGEVGVDPHPAAIAAWIEPGQRVAENDRMAVDGEVVVAATFDRSMPAVHRHLLAVAGAQLPVVRGSECRQCDAGLRRLAHRERRRQRRRGARQPEVLQRLQRQLCMAPQVGDVVDGVHGMACDVRLWL